MAGTTTRSGTQGGSGGALRTAPGPATGAKAAVESVPSRATQARSKPAFQRFARLGIGSRAVIYALLAGLTADIAATGGSPAQASGSGALAEVVKQPGGRVALGVLAVGLAGYACWRVAQALSSGPSRGSEQTGASGRRHEKEREAGREAAGALERVGRGLTAAVYFGLCAQAVTLMVGPGGGGQGGGGVSSHPQPLVAQVLRWPGGPAWAGLVGVGVGVGGVVLAVWGATHDPSDVFGRGRLSPRAVRAVRVAGGVGEVTRGLLIVLVSAYLLAAAVTDNPSKAKSLDQALRAFARLPAGPALLALAAAGLACFAGYSVVEALRRQV